MASPNGFFRNHFAQPTAKSLAPGQRQDLTPCQFEIVRRLVEAKSNRAIACDLNRSPHTVKKHLENILDNLGVPNRAGAVNWWHEHGKKHSAGAARTTAKS
jgi:LuxR family maltose regulon positive regulatory protein